MNRFKAVGSAFLLVPTLALLSTQARAEFKCNSQAVIFDRVACEKAKEGPDALRRYIQRIQGIASLQFSDYVSEAQAAAWAQNEASRAPKKSPVQSAKIVQENPGA
jgi:cell division protein FtsX